jgi:pimeloyl-ACP methyl ester carboxylesterase
MRPWLLILPLLLPACRTLEPAALPGLPQSNRPAVFIADGAGDFRACSETFRQTAAEDQLNLDVVTFVWSHGYLRNLADQTDVDHAHNRGLILAEMVRQTRQRFPDAPISLVAHSAGSSVVLAAAENSPSGSIDRIILLAPSMSENYDLRPALMASRNGIDAFISDEDWVWLGLLVDILGTPDDPRSVRASGRYGFTLPPTDPLFHKLRVHRWTRDQQLLDNDGGHFGDYQPAFIRQRILPLLMQGRQTGNCAVFSN